MEYQHGGDIYGEARISLDFSVNTNPLGMPEPVKQAVLSEAASWQQYPDSKSRVLRQALASFYGGQTAGLSPEDFICGNGAADLLYSLIYGLRPDKALLFVPCFGEYEAALQAAGCRVQKVYTKPETGFTMAFTRADMERLLTAELDMVILGNPNNPTGTAVLAAELKMWADICRKRNILLVVDECFNCFLEDPKAYSLAGFLAEYPNVFLLNAFTKSHAMAGLRLGYGICTDPAVLERIERSRQPWSVSAPAQAAGLKALKETAFVRESRQLIKEERCFLRDGLAALGFEVYASMVNYLLFKSSDDLDYGRLLKNRGILIRSCAGFDGLDSSYYRIAVKKRQENETLLRLLKEIKEAAWQR